jgi:hypothetical protein
MKNRIFIPFVTIMSLCFASCQNKEQGATDAPVSPVRQERPADSIVFKGYSIHLAKLPFTYVTQNEKGAKLQYDEAYIVMFEVKDTMKSVSQNIAYAIGGYILPEYGGWKNGIYFKIYDRALLERLNNKEIRYRLPHQKEMVSTGKVFKVEGLKSLKLENEDDLIRKQK